MKHMIRRLWACLLCGCFLLGLAPGALAEGEAVAEDITAATSFSGTGYGDFSFLKDGDVDRYQTSAGDVELTLTSDRGMGALYLLFDLEYGPYTITDNATGEVVTAGQYEMLHELVDLSAAFGYAPTCVTLRFASGAVRLSEVYAFTPGALPSFVQQWRAPLKGRTDLLLLSTHGDDDQLFFAGLLPYYAVHVGCEVQVVYLTDHRNSTNERTHEMLNGLWSVGVTAYPVFGRFADFRIDDLQGTYNRYAQLGTTQEELQSFMVMQLRRFKPQVVVGHDVNGEYGHGMHQVYTDLLMKALESSADPAYFPASAEWYGVWDVPKTYLHLYWENQIVLDYDQPLAEFGGMSAFAVSQKLGYPCHKSQQWTWFTDWINGYNNEITLASQIATYNPCQFGLYRSTVGEDLLKNDFLENIVTYAEQERLEQERLEQERLEQERLEQERQEQERLEQERLEQERLAQERLEQQKRLRDQIAVGAALAAALVILLLVWLWLRRRRRRGRHSGGRNRR